MSKQISPEELAHITNRLLMDVEQVHLTDNDRLSFMTQLAQLVCHYVGGAVHNPASYVSEEECFVGVHGNGRIPDVHGGIWADYDPEGELFDKGRVAWYVARYNQEHPRYPRGKWQEAMQELSESKKGLTYEQLKKMPPAPDYWQWVDELELKRTGNAPGQ